MKMNIKNISIFIFSLLILSSCTKNSDQPEQTKPSAPTTMTSPDVQPAPTGFTGRVIETMSTAGYTYVQVDTGKEKIWAAAPEFKVNEGETVTIPAGAPMKNYQSKTLNRTFDVVWFVPSIKSCEDSAKMEMSTTPVTASKKPQTCAVPPAAPDFSSIKKAEGGNTIAEIFTQKSSLEGKNVTVRGKVVKYNGEIMNTNWIHIQDGTGDKGTNDLTITTKGTAKTGDTILVKGTLVLNKDFGYGYKYDVIIENAAISKD